MGMLMAKRCYYDVLGLPKSAADDEIKKAYRKLAMQYHPDRNVGDKQAEDKFKEATEAYEVLISAEKRQRYDRYGHAGVENMDAGSGFAQTDLNEIFNDLLGGFFGAGPASSRRRSGPQPGRDIQVVLDITLAEVATGVKKSVTIHRDEPCPTCQGTGARPGTQPTICRRCGGQGVVIQRQGFFQIQQTCRSCDGAGVVITDPCSNCRGTGKVTGKRTLDVEIPPGVDTGDRIRFPGHGDAGAAGAARGDLEFVIRVKEHRFFQRDGQNLICQWPITFSQAALGATLELTTLTGETIRYELPRGTQTHEVLRIAGQGLPGRRGGRRGDLLVQVLVDTPQHLSPEQETLFRQLAELEKQQQDRPPDRKSFFSRLRDWLTSEDK